MVLGDTELLTENIKKDFIQSGITHILVVSGSNIALVIILALSILRYFPIPQWMKIFSIVSFVILYATIVGWGISVIRAVIMGIIAFLGTINEKKLSTVSILS